MLKLHRYYHTLERAPRPRDHLAAITAATMQHHHQQQRWCGALALRESRAPVHVSARRSHKKAGGGGSGGALALFRSGRTLRVRTLSALADGLVDRTFTIKAGTAATLHGGQAAGPPVPRTAIIDGAKRARPATKRDDGAACMREQPRRRPGLESGRRRCRCRRTMMSSMAQMAMPLLYGQLYVWRRGAAACGVLAQGIFTLVSDADVAAVESSCGGGGGGTTRACKQT